MSTSSSSRSPLPNCRILSSQSAKSSRVAFCSSSCARKHAVCAKISVRPRRAPDEIQRGDTDGSPATKSPSIPCAATCEMAHPLFRSRRRSSVVHLREALPLRQKNASPLRLLARPIYFRWSFRRFTSDVTAAAPTRDSALTFFPKAAPE